jgi:hypothetical protein
MCNRAFRFRESAQNGAAILLYLERARPDWEPASPTLYVAWVEKLIGTMPDAAPHCGPRPDGTSHRAVVRMCGLYDSKTGRKREGLQGHSATDFLMKNVKMDV